MRGRWELSDAQLELIEPILRPKRRADGRDRPWQDTRAVLNVCFCGPWAQGSGTKGADDILNSIGRFASRTLADAWV